MNNNGIALTGDDAKDKDILLKAEVEKLVAENLKKSKDNLTEEEKAILANQGSEAAKQPFKMTLFGREVEYPDQATAFAEVEKAMMQLTQQLNEVKASPKTEKKTEDDQFNKDKMVELMDKDVLQGLQYALGHIPEVKNLKEKTSHLEEDNTRLKQALAIHQFKSTMPGVGNNPQEIQAINQVLNEFRLSPDNPASLEAAYHVAAGRGWIKPQEKQERVGTTAPPFVGRGSNEPVSADFASMVKRLSKEQIKQLIDSRQFS